MRRRGRRLAAAAGVGLTGLVAALLALLLTAADDMPAAQGARHPGPVAVEGTRFVAAGGAPFEWRGITAFALLDQVTDGRKAEADAFLRWARERGFTVVRVLGMARNLFPLSPEEGLEGMRELLRLAASHGLMVELVLFADTAGMQGFDLQAHAAKVAAAVSGAENLFIELANENHHSAQDPRLTDPEELTAIRARLPATVPVSLGSLHAGDLRLERFRKGDYGTVHIDRSAGPWEHVGLTADLAELAGRVGMPVVSDEPIGAGERPEPRRRLDDPAVFFGLGVLSRMAGVPTTFHCKDCMFARPLGAKQDASARAFIEGTRLLPGGRRFTSFAPAPRILETRDVAGATAVHAAADESNEWVVVAALGASADLSLPLAPGWSVTELASRPGIKVYRARRK